jgi:hypothetical protein
VKPSVTNLVDMLDKPALMRWANKIGLEGIKLDEYKSQKKDEGSSIHETIATYLNFNILPDDENLTSRIENFFRDKEVIEVEKTVETEYFIGRLDIKLKWKDFVFICDFKSSKGVYLETKLQLAAYKMAEPCDHVAVIHLPEFLIRPVDVNGIHTEFIITLSKLYELKQRIENGK